MMFIVKCWAESGGVGGGAFPVWWPATGSSRVGEEKTFEKNAEEASNADMFPDSVLCGEINFW